MNKIILSILTFIVILTVTILSCKKSQVYQESNVVNLLKMSESQKVRIISEDDDWKLIANKNLETINKLVNSKIDINKINLNNEDEFLKILGKSKSDYLKDASEIQSAARRLVEKYNLNQQPNTNNDCLSCNTPNDEVQLKIKSTVKLFRENKQSFEKFQNLVVAPTSAEIIADDGSGGGGLCCPWRFYACVSLCAATIELFPAYLLCTGFCFDSYCCK